MSSALARAVADDPGGRAHDARRRSSCSTILATNPYLDASSVEAIITAGLLHAPGAGGAAIGDGLDVVARLVAISDDDQLNDGTKRGVAASMLTFFPLLAPQLDVRIPVVVPYGTDPDDTVEIGSYCDVQRLIGQLLTDARAQLVLGAMTERYRVAATAGLAGAIAARPRRRRRRAPGPDRGRARRRQCHRRAGVALARRANLPRRVRARSRRRTREVGDHRGRPRSVRWSVPPSKRGAPGDPARLRGRHRRARSDRAGPVGRPRHRRRHPRSASP